MSRFCFWSTPVGEQTNSVGFGGGDVKIADMTEKPFAALVPYRRDLFLAIRYGNANEVERLLAGGANPNWNDRRGTESALAYAALVSTPDVVRVLLTYGATDKGEMPLEEAVTWPRGDEPVTEACAKARLLLEYGGAAVNLGGQQGRVPLITAAGAGDMLSVQLFLDHGAGVHAKDALPAALEENHHDVAELLRKAGA